MADDWNLAEKKFNIEHALAMEARETVIMPVRFLYEPERLSEYAEILSRCHIYMIGHVPDCETDGVGVIDGQFITTKWLIGGKPYEVRTDLGITGCQVHHKNGWWSIIDPQGNHRDPTNLIKVARKQVADEHTALPFKILYIGQAFGKNGSRQALDRLLKGHEKLQEILVKGPPEKHGLYLLLVDVAPGTNVHTIFNPKAQNQDKTYERIFNGLSAQDETTEAEKTTLYEASLIRYFEPPYNKEFKETFPSTNMSLLQGCYEKDINTIIAEINIDAEFQLMSDKIQPRKSHMANHELHSDKDRKIFFGLT